MVVRSNFAICSAGGPILLVLHCQVCSDCSCCLYFVCWC